jgi:hypothetical protein
MWEHIQPGLEDNFKSYSPATVTTLGQTYDYDSVLHYSAIAFSKDHEYTLYPYKTDPSRLGQRLKFSQIDINKVNLAYNCKENELHTDDDPVGRVANGPDLVLGLPGVCHDQNPVTAAMMHKGHLYLFKGDSFWIFQAMTPQRYMAKNHLAMSLYQSVSDALPENFNYVTPLNNRFYFFSNHSVVTLTSFSKNAVFDQANQTVFFPQITWNVKGLFFLGNGSYFSDGKSVFLYDSQTEKILSSTLLGPETGLPFMHDFIVNVPDDRLLIFSGYQVFLTKPSEFKVEDGFPLRFYSMFCL